MNESARARILKRLQHKERTPKTRGDDVQRREEFVQQSTIFQRCGGGRRIIRKKLGGV